MPPNEIMNMVRRDIGNLLFHFAKIPSAPISIIRGQSVTHLGQTPYAVLKKILQERQLNGSSGFIRGGHNCVCFTESPISELSAVFSLANCADTSDHSTRYKPYGIAVKKDWLFRQGGRPVIYQADSEYAALPLDLQHRHVRYEPDNGVDFTWEREWRIKINELPIPFSDILVVVPTAEEAFEIMHEFSSSEPNSYDDEGNPDAAGGTFTYPTLQAVSLDLFGLGEF